MNKIIIHFAINSLHGGGAERVLALLANQLDQMGYSVSIITFNPGNDYPINSDIKKIELHHGSIKNHKLRSWNNLKNYYKLKNNRPDVLISFLTLNSAIAITVAKLFHIKIIASEHINHLRSGRPKWLTKFTRNYLYRFADAVTVLTSFDLEYFMNKGVNVLVMPNPCTFKAITEAPVNREKLIIAAGNLDRYHHKGFDNLLKFMQPILLQYPEWKLEIAGGGEKGLKYLSDLRKSLGLEDRVTFLGFQADVQDNLRNAEIYVLSSRFEGLPMVLLEAMSQGCACVSYDCITGPSDIIDHGINGLLVPDQNQEVMQDTLKVLIQNDKIRKELQKQAPKRVADFDMETIANKWETLFKEIGI